MSSVFHVLLTGGVGSRLWPLSRKSRPKQYLPIFAKQSLFEMAVERNKPFTNGLIVVGNRGNRNLSQETLSKLGITDYLDIVEAAPRNTAAAIAFAAFAAQTDDTLLITPSDHIIKEGETYSSAINEALELAGKGAIVAFGIKPKRAETGYGYIEHNGVEVISFREKPSLERAKEFLDQDSFLWNSGMFCFKAGVFLEELQIFAPEIYEKSLKSWREACNNELEESSSLRIPSVSVDYAVMEKSDKMKVVESDFEWSDMGSFEAVYDYLRNLGEPVDEFGNMQIGSQNYTAFAGLQNCILVQTADANLILAKEASQDVKNIYIGLEKTNPILLE